MNGDLTASIIVGGLPIDTSVPGTHTVTYDVTDSSGNTVHAERTVNVVDTTPPVFLSVPDDVLVDSTETLTTVNIDVAIVTDNIGILSLTNDAPAQFPQGITIVTWTATDTSGNINTATQNIRVQEPLLPIVQLRGDTLGDSFGGSIASAGDFNGDGIEDIIVGASGATNNGEQFAGSTFIFFGRNTASPLDLTATANADVIIQGQNNGDSVGKSIASAGDFNGDGFGDVIIGTSKSSNGIIGSGAALIFFGNNTTQQLILNADTDANIVIEGQSSYGWLGTSVAPAGDFNGDGLDDVVVGTPFGSTNGLSNSGNAFIFFGQNPSVQTILNANTDADVILDGRISFGDFGRTVASAGDFNGDGLNDVIVGAYADGNQAGEQSGAAFIFFGRNSATGQINLNADTDADVILSGQNTWDAFGLSVGLAGDFNNDGLSDVIVGAVLDDNNGETNSGSAFIFFGRNTTTQLILEADADANVILDGQSGILSNDLFIFGDAFGNSVASAGDFNNDGFDDVIVGAFSDDNNGITDSGSAFIFFGQNPASQTVLRANRDADIVLNGQNMQGFFGNSVAFAGDFNGDGIDDVIVGTPYAALLSTADASIFPGSDPDAPTITVSGDNPATIDSGLAYVDAGATATDVEDGDITSSIVVIGLPVDTNIPGSHTVTYQVTDSSGNSAQAVRTVKVIGDIIPPVVTAPADVGPIEALGATTPVAIGTATATDNVAVASITSNAPASFPVGLTVVTWTATDTAGNTGTATQNVTVQDTTTPDRNRPCERDC